MDIRSDSGLEVFPVDTEHKFAVSISSYPEQVITPALEILLYSLHATLQVYYPINTYSYNEMASFVGDIKRVVGPAPALASNGNSYIMEVI